MSRGSITAYNEVIFFTKDMMGGSETLCRVSSVRGTGEGGGGGEGAGETAPPPNPPPPPPPKSETLSLIR